jgi:hypothetical protein
MRQVLRIFPLALLALVFFRPAVAQVAISVNFAPPALPVYEQPPCPEEGYIWVPGYWAWDSDDEDYYWVPGTWVLAPEPGLLWTPAWWGWDDGAYMFHDGFWASEVGWYGGIDYGYGYFGHGFEGGRWQNDHFYYNRAVENVNVTVIHNVYEDRTVINNVHETRVSYNGGQGGIQERPTPREEQVSHLQHFPPARPQEQRIQMARSNPQMRASANQGRPPIAATARPTEFSGHDVVPARAAGAPYHPPANRPAPGGRQAGPGGENARPPENARPGENARPAELGRPGGNPNEPGSNNMPTHARDLQPHQAPPPPEGGNAAADRKYQQQEQKLIEKQNQEHQRLAQQQQKEDQRAQQQRMNQQKQQQMEQRHQQQTQQMEQRHQQQQQHVEQRRPQPPPRPQEEHPKRPQ